MIALQIVLNFDLFKFELDGMHKQVVEQILKTGAKRVVYISCNSATQARDLSLMDDLYKIIHIQPIDMFPQTHHVENIVVLEKK